MRKTIKNLLENRLRIPKAIGIFPSWWAMVSQMIIKSACFVLLSNVRPI